MPANRAEMGKRMETCPAGGDDSDGGTHGYSSIPESQTGQLASFGCIGGKEIRRRQVGNETMGFVQNAGRTPNVDFEGGRINNRTKRDCTKDRDDYVMLSVLGCSSPARMDYRPLKPNRQVRVGSRRASRPLVMSEARVGQAVCAGLGWAVLCWRALSRLV